MVSVLKQPKRKNKRKTREVKPLPQLASPEVMSVQSADVVSSEQNVAFYDAVDEEVVPVPVTMSSMQIDTSTNIDLGNFFQRPVLIQTYSWAENTLFTQSFSPWKDYFNTASVKKKLDNFHLIRCNLNLKFVINASPFYYSCVMVTYRPLSNLASGDYYEPCAVNGGTGISDQTLMGRSQRPRVMLYPQNSQGGSLKLPFFYPKNWLNVNVAKDFENMGTINMDTLFMVLENANNVTGTGCTIQVYAWADSVELAGPTVGLSLQSKDEYGKGPVSGPASAIARFAGTFSSHPIVGPFATATALVAGATSAVAALFGYTNVPVIDNVHSNIIKTNPNFGATDIGIPTEKLTLDSKNELSIDNRVCGIDVGDELMIDSIVTRESFIGTYSWGAGDAPNALIFNSRVTPEICLKGTSAGQVYVQGTPMWMVSQMFRYWRGDITFRFKILCTQYHRGRLKIAWDPAGDIANTNESTNLVYTRIVDITETDDISITVPYTQVVSYLQMLRTNDVQFGTTPLTNTFGNTNGVLTVRVLTKQTAPSADAPISVAVFVSGSPNLEFADPQPPPSELTLYTIQSKDVYIDRTVYKLQSQDVVTSMQDDIGISPSQAAPFLNLIHMGEHVVSLRVLLRRSFLHRTIRWFSTDYVANAINYISSTCPRMPLYYGWDLNGINTALNASAISKPFNYVHSTPINWISSCFVGVRGSVTWHIDTNLKNNAPQTVVVDRRRLTLSLALYKFLSNVIITGSSSAWMSRANKTDGAGGMALSDTQVQHGGHFQVPYYSKLKFHSTNPLYRTFGSAVDDTINDSFTVYSTTFLGTPVANDSLKIDYYCSAGTDFNPVWFLNVPGYIVTTLPNPS